MADFNIVYEAVQGERVRGSRISKTFYPLEGNNCGIIFVNTGSEGAAILALLNEIEALADEFKKLTWVAAAEAGFRPSVNVRVTVDDRASLETPGP